MTHYVGIDVSLETSSMSIMDARGAIRHEFKAESEPAARVIAELDRGWLRYSIDGHNLFSLP